MESQVLASNVSSGGWINPIARKEKKNVKM